MFNCQQIHTCYWKTNNVRNTPCCIWPCFKLVLAVLQTVASSSTPKSKVVHVLSLCNITIYICVCAYVCDQCQVINLQNAHCFFKRIKHSCTNSLSPQRPTINEFMTCAAPSTKLDKLIALLPSTPVK